MAIIYTVIFLTLFALFSNSLQKSHLHLMRTKPYSQWIFPKYVHHRRSDRIKGLDLKVLIESQADSAKMQDIFRRLIELAYEGTEVYQIGLADELLQLFQTQIIFDKTKMKSDEYHHVNDLNDLDNIPVPESLAVIYPKLMNGSELDEDTSAGYPSLKRFLAVPGSSAKSKINLLEAHPKLIEAMFGLEFAEEVVHFKKERLDSYKYNDKPLEGVWGTYCSTYSIDANLKKWVELRYPGNEDPTSDR